MNRTRIAALLASVALLAPPAFAQQGTAPDGATTTVPPGIPPHTTPTAPDGTSPSTSPTGQVDVQTKPDLGATAPAPAQSDAPTGGTAAPDAVTPPAAGTTTPPAAESTPPAATPATPPATVPDKPAMATGLLAPEGYTQVDDFAGVTAEQLKGAELRSAEGKDVGKISDLSMDASAKADGLIADIGGFLGLGSHTVRLTPEQIGIFKNADDKVIVVSSLNEDVLKSLPAWEAPKP